jgi:hypothetical protein
MYSTSPAACLQSGVTTPIVSQHCIPAASFITLAHAHVPAALSYKPCTHTYLQVCCAAWCNRGQHSTNYPQSRHHKLAALVSAACAFAAAACWGVAH